jgi:hypothetical protein
LFYKKKSSTILAQISQYSTFSNVISSIASLSSTQCCIFSLLGRTRFAAVAASYLVKYKIKKLFLFDINNLHISSLITLIWL